MIEQPNKQTTTWQQWPTIQHCHRRTNNLGAAFTNCQTKNHRASKQKKGEKKIK